MELLFTAPSSNKITLNSLGIFNEYLIKTQHNHKLIITNNGSDIADLEINLYSDGDSLDYFGVSLSEALNLTISFDYEIKSEVIEVYGII
jgi:hypothetical protein